MEKDVEGTKDSEVAQDFTLQVQATETYTLNYANLFISLFNNFKELANRRIHTAKYPTQCNSVSKFIIPYLYDGQQVWGRHTAHNQEPKTALATSGFA